MMNPSVTLAAARRAGVRPTLVRIDSDMPREHLEGLGRSRILFTCVAKARTCGMLVALTEDSCS